jgi:hypothetical protein
LPYRDFTYSAWLRPLEKYQLSNRSSPTIRDTPSRDLGFGKKAAANVIPTIESSVTNIHIFAAEALTGSPSASQFFICRYAPKAGLKRRLQFAAEPGFQIAGDTSSCPMSASLDFGGAYRFSVTASSQMIASRSIGIISVSELCSCARSPRLTAIQAIMFTTDCCRAIPFATLARKFVKAFLLSFLRF